MRPRIASHQRAPNFGASGGATRSDNLIAFALAQGLAGIKNSAAALTKKDLLAAMSALSPAAAGFAANALTWVPEYGGFDTATCDLCGKKWVGKQSSQAARAALWWEYMGRTNPFDTGLDFDTWLQRRKEDYWNPAVPGKFVYPF